MAKNTVVNMRPVEVRFTSTGGLFTFTFGGNETVLELAKKFKSIEALLKAYGDDPNVKNMEMTLSYLGEPERRSKFIVKAEDKDNV